MKSDVIVITNRGEGFERARNEVRKVSVYKELDEKETRHMLLFTEEMLSVAGIIDMDMDASFWVEGEGKDIELHMTTTTALDAKTRAQLINAATSRKNDAAHSFIGKIRDIIEQTLASENTTNEPPYEIMSDIQGRDIQDPEWDEYECSILRNLADSVKVSIRGDVVDMTVSKHFA